MLAHEWKKSTRSNGTGGSNCVEAKLSEDDFIFVRDTKEHGSGIQSTLSFTRDEWSAFIEGVKAGEFDI